MIRASGSRSIRCTAPLVDALFTKISTNHSISINYRCQDAACLRKMNSEDLMDAVPPQWFAVNTGLPETKEVNNKKHEWLVKDDIIIQQHIGTIFSQKEDLPVKVVMGTTAQSGQLPKELSYSSEVDPEKIKQTVRNSLLGNMGQADKAIACVKFSICPPEINGFFPH